MSDLPPGPVAAVLYVLAERGAFPDPAEAALELLAFGAVKQFERVPITLLIEGYDDDPRELLDIPEAIRFMRAFAHAMTAICGHQHWLGRIDPMVRPLYQVAAGQVHRGQIVFEPRREGPDA